MKLMFWMFVVINLVVTLVDLDIRFVIGSIGQGIEIAYLSLYFLNNVNGKFLRK